MVSNILKLYQKNYLINKASMKICPVELFKTANFSESDSSDYSVFPHYSITRQNRTIYSFTENFPKNYLTNSASSIKIHSAEIT